MSQQDFNITTADANTGISFRAAVNAALQALVSTSSGTSEPVTKYPFQFWADSDTDTLKMRNAANDAWISVLQISTSRSAYIPSTVTSTELGYLAGVTSAIQTQLTTLANALALKSNIASPTFTGTPKAPTAAQGTATTQIATTEFAAAAAAAAAQYDGGPVSSPILAPIGLGYAFDGDGDTGLSLTAANEIAIFTGGYPRMSFNDIAYRAAIGNTMYPAYFTRAWVNFDGTGTVAIRGSGNVSSITDNGTGDYTINFTTAMPDANYAVTGTSLQSGVLISLFSATVYATGSVRIVCGSDIGYILSTRADQTVVGIAIFR